MLAEAVLDAETKLGELFKQIPKATNNGANQYQGASPTAVSEKQKTKAEVISDLGFSEKQAERFEILADNPDVVEFVKAEARENEDVPTRGRVIELVTDRKKKDGGYDGYFRNCTRVCGELNKIVENIDKFEVTESRINAIIENFNGASNATDTIKYVERGRDKLTTIIAELRKAEKRSKEA